MEMFYNYFTIKEVFQSCSDKEVCECIRDGRADSLFFLISILDAFREFVSCPVILHSTFRDIEHNRKVGGVSTSQHLTGSAVDFHVHGITHLSAISRLKDFCKESSFAKFLGQIIIYDSFFHVALCSPTHKKICFYDKRTSKEFN